MTVVRFAGNKTLKGHKLLVISHHTPPPETLERIRDRFPDLQIAIYPTVRGSRAPAEGFSEDEWKDTTILLTWSSLPDKDQAPKLRYIQLTSAGANHILKNPLFLETDVAFCTANGVHGPQISEWIVATFLSFQHQIPGYLELQQKAHWQRLSVAADDSVGQRIGILGYGSIGRQTARLAKALGMDVYAYNLHPRPTPESRRDTGYTPPGLGDPEGEFPSKWFSGGTTEELHEFLGSGLDLLVVALPLTEKTHHLLSAPEFEVLSKKKTFVVNIARGPIIATDDLITALNEEKIRGAALDVTDPEPLPDGHPLWSAKNVLITPHVSGESNKYEDRIWAITEHNLTRLSEGQELTNKVDRKEGY